MCKTKEYLKVLSRWRMDGLSPTPGIGHSCSCRRTTGQWGNRRKAPVRGLMTRSSALNLLSSARQQTRPPAHAALLRMIGKR
ncbi:hypothetical protein GOP47_0014895 [Adiantum capillus-veneris]|uniref:Uncharacterized protein n=1 Tax=Adiantum capillus-veneris TaxID=13818 RepID=A0A9D4ZDY0_ADICA|nr:hypothetical protein GOP47_0014895 [Adiantum capillus-veneris]